VRLSRSEDGLVEVCIGTAARLSGMRSMPPLIDTASLRWWTAHGGRPHINQNPTAEAAVAT